ncbi:DUF1554 domain-containing protein [Oligoflexaceae bacterium]|nr:DUF1554 domain-containing protein [Oligoflexaceae bacterium]
MFHLATILGLGLIGSFGCVQKTEAPIEGNSDSKVVSSTSVSETTDLTDGVVSVAKHDSVKYSLVISWESTNDSSGSAAEYKVYLSSSDNIADYSSAVANGTAISGWMNDSSEAAVFGLEDLTTYYINVFIRDNVDGDKYSYGTASFKTPDWTSPMPGSAISFSHVTNNEIRLSYGEASDSATTASELEYKIVTAATVDEIDTVEECEALTAPSIVSDWTANSLAYNHESLTTNGNYCYTVLVRDAEENKAVYTPACQSTNLKMFVTSFWTDGDIDSNGDGTAMPEADAICQSDINKPAGAAAYKAMLSDGTNRKSTVGSQIDWVLRPNSEYYQENGSTLIATSTSAGVFTFNLDNAISTESEEIHTGIGFNWDSHSIYDCENWSIDSGGNVEWGTSDALTDDALSTNLSNCSVSRPIYCVQQ